MKHSDVKKYDIFIAYTFNLGKSWRKDTKVSM